MKYYIWTTGCQMNVADSQRVASALEKLGYNATPRAENADVIVLNTCVVRQSAEDKAYGKLNALRPIKRARPEVIINLMGCLVGVKGNQHVTEAFPFVDVFSPPSDPAPLTHFLLQRQAQALREEETAARFALMDEEFILPKNERGRLVSAYVPVVLGCSHACAYCIIPYRRGAEESRPLPAILAEVKTLAQQGIKEVTLLGQIIDRYGKDLPEEPSLSDLLRAVHEVQGIERIRFLTSHPNWMTGELLDTVATLPKVCPHIEAPIQAGDDAVLQNMKRGYTVEQYRRLINRIRERVPGASIATDIIVGFPGETKAQFEGTVRVLEDLRMDVAHLARYSPRSGTLSARKMQDDVPDDEKMRRFRILESLQEGIAADINAQLLGQAVEVLVEGKQRGRWKGRTQTNKLVFFDDPQDLHGQIVQVLIEHTGPWSLQGTLVAPTSQVQAA